MIGGMDSKDPDIVRKNVGVAAGMLGALVARQVIHRVRRGKGRPGKVEAMLWTALVGAGAQVGRIGAQRAVAAVQTRRA
jgi:hypothetical protein